MLDIVRLSRLPSVENMSLIHGGNSTSFSSRPNKAGKFQILWGNFLHQGQDRWRVVEWGKIKEKDDFDRSQSSRQRVLKAGRQASQT